MAQKEKSDDIWNIKMALCLYNTLSRKVEIFSPLKKDYVTIYDCGPTVYFYIHIGNCRAFIVADILRRYLEYKGYKVKQVMNITDVDDKTIRDSQKEGISLKGFTEKYTKAFFEDLKTLNIRPAQVYPKATEHIKEMVDIIRKLKEKGYTYESEGSTYYRISKFEEYGKLAKINIKELKSGARVKQDEYTKEDAHDFALWKAWDESDGDVFWETELGKGRPGWHIECSAMSMKHLGETFDIHTGGIDLIFPHHENEIAQSEAATGKQFVRYWIHNEYILVDGKKMSKSLGNFYLLRDLLAKGYDPKAIRYLLLSTHYRQPLNFTLEGIDAAKSAVERIQNFIDHLNSIKKNKDNKKVTLFIKKVKKEFEEHLDFDLNISSALASIFEFLNEIYKIGISKKDAQKIIRVMKEFDSVLGILDFEKQKLDKKIEEMVEEREYARKKKEWAKADKIRAELKEQGIILEDTPEGVRWKKIS